MEHDMYMKMALIQAEHAFADNEIPIGCIIVDKDGIIIGSSRNKTFAGGKLLCHAEIMAIDEACKNVGDWRLTEATMYVTIEPCPMCAGAILMARIPTVVFGAKNPKAGCAGSLYNLLDDSRFNHRATVIHGVLAAECGDMMTRFFRKK